MQQYCSHARWKMAVEQRTNIKFCLKLGKTAGEAYEIKSVYDSDCSSRSNIFRWYAGMSQILRWSDTELRRQRNMSACTLNGLVLCRWRNGPSSQKAMPLFDFPSMSAVTRGLMTLTDSSIPPLTSLRCHVERKLLASQPRRPKWQQNGFVICPHETSVTLHRILTHFIRFLHYLAACCETLFEKTLLLLIKWPGREANNIVKVKKIFLRNSPRRPIGLWNVKDLKFSRQSAQRWR
jgi:hypothetical protein